MISNQCCRCEAADCYCLVFCWNPLQRSLGDSCFSFPPAAVTVVCVQVQFYGFPFVPVKPNCPDCGTSHGVEGAGLSDTLRLIYSMHAHPGGVTGNMYIMGQTYKHTNCPKHAGTILMHLFASDLLCR